MTKALPWSGALALLGVVWWASLGFSGLSPEHVDALLTGAGSFVVDESPISRWITSALVEWRPDGFVTTFWTVSTSLVALSVVALYLGARRAFLSQAAAAFAALVFVGSIESYWAASSAPGPALALLIVSLVFLVSTLERAWIRYSLLGILAAVSLALMPPLAIAIGGIWAVESLSFRRGPACASGVSAKLSIPVAYFGSLLSFGVASLGLCLAFGFNAEDAWTWLSGVLRNSDALTHLGIQYVDSRPPLWTGLAIFLTETPLALIVLSGMALFFRERVPPRTGRTLICLLIVGLVVPWLIRGTAWSDIPVNLMWVPVYSLFAGLALEGMTDVFEKTRNPSKPAPVAITAALTLVLASVYLETLAHRQAPDTYRNALWSHTRCLESGDPLKRSTVWPPSAFDGRNPHGSPLDRLAEVYATQGLVNLSRSTEPSGIGYVSSRASSAPPPSDPFATPATPWSVHGIPLLWSEVSRPAGDQP